MGMHKIIFSTYNHIYYYAVLLSAKYWGKKFSLFILNNSESCIVIMPFFLTKTLRLERLNNILKVMQLLNQRGSVWIQEETVFTF